MKSSSKRRLSQLSCPRILKGCVTMAEVLHSVCFYAAAIPFGGKGGWHRVLGGSRP